MTNEFPTTESHFSSVAEFHHVGFACESMKVAIKKWSALSYSAEGPSFDDDLQGVKVQFMVGPGPRIELLSPLEDSRTLTPWLDRGGGAYHFAYLVSNLIDAIADLVSQGAMLVRPPLPATAFGGREIAFLMLQRGWLVELIEGESNG